MSRLQHYVSEIVAVVLTVMIVAMVLGIAMGLFGCVLLGIRAVWSLLLGVMM